MHRFFAPLNNISNNKITIAEKVQVHHLRDVLRFKLNDKVTVFDEQGNEYNCLIKKISSTVTLEIKDKHKTEPENKMQITIACAIPKKSKMDDIVDKLTQIGVARIIPLETERVIIKWDKNKKAAQQKRWEKIALSASQQSQRNSIPAIEPVQDMSKVLSRVQDYDLKLIPTLEGQRKSLKEIFSLPLPLPSNILILIGPEGDFTPEEVQMAIKAGCIPVTLGDLVLRVDTAAIAMASFIKLYY